MEVNYPSRAKTTEKASKEGKIGQKNYQKFTEEAEMDGWEKGERRREWSEWIARNVNRFACHDKTNDSEIKLNYVALYRIVFVLITTETLETSLLIATAATEMNEKEH